VVDDYKGVDFTRNKTQIKPWETTFFEQNIGARSKAIRDGGDILFCAIFSAVPFSFSYQHFLSLCFMWRILDDDMGFSCFQQEFGSLWILGHISILNRTAMFSKA